MEEVLRRCHGHTRDWQQSDFDGIGHTGPDPVLITFQGLLSLEYLLDLFVTLQPAQPPQFCECGIVAIVTQSQSLKIVDDSCRGRLSSTVQQQLCRS